MPGICRTIDDQTVRWLSTCIASIEQIEEATGLKSFQSFNTNKNWRLRQASTKQTWFDWLDM